MSATPLKVEKLGLHIFWNLQKGCYSEMETKNWFKEQIRNRRREVFLLWYCDHHFHNHPYFNHHGHHHLEHTAAWGGARGVGAEEDQVGEQDGHLGIENDVYMFMKD